MRILGIDPGFVSAGFCIMDISSGKISILDWGALKMSSSNTIAERILIFHDFFEEKIMTFVIKKIGLETPFLGKNAQNFLKLGYLRGIIYLLASKHQIDISEFAPKEVKLAITGFGGADKEQVCRAILTLFPALKAPDKKDITDAAAVCLSTAWDTKKTVYEK